MLKASLNTHDFINSPNWSNRSWSNYKPVYLRFVCSKCNSIFDRDQKKYAKDNLCGWILYPCNDSFFYSDDLDKLLSCNQIILKSIL